MSYQVIARKYRPQRFEDVVGQEHVTRTLSNAIHAGRVGHAYLFCGPRGTGKTTIARIFAKALNCTGGPRTDFDDGDPRCREIAEGRSLDVLEIDGASTNGVDQVRELRDTARFAPASSKFKIYIIDEVHMLTTAAFNALLKTLEEPPAHVKFLFATTDPEKVLPTILSRCQRFDLRRIPSALIVQHLTLIAGQEGVSLDDAALHAIARGADGGMRDAESTLDQLISFCGDRVEEADVLSMFGLAARAQILALSRAVLVDEPSRALRELDELMRHGKDVGRLLADLLDHFRNLLVYLVTGGDLSLLDISEADAAELKTQSGLAPADAVTRVLEVLTAADGRLRDAAARRIFLEVTLLKAIQARKAVSLDAVLTQLQQLRGEAEGATGGGAVGKRSLQAGVPAAGPREEPARPTPAPIPAPASSPVTEKVEPPPARASAPGTARPMDDVWGEVVATASPVMRPALQAGRFQSAEKGQLAIGYPASLDSQRSLVDTDRGRKAIEAKLAELGRPMTVRFIRLPDDAATPTSVASAGVPSPAMPAADPPPPPSTAGTATAPPLKARPEKAAPIKMTAAEFKDDPLIKEALELFRGNLVEVRGPDSGAGA